MNYVVDKRELVRIDDPDSDWASMVVPATEADICEWEDSFCTEGDLQEALDSKDRLELGDPVHRPLAPRKTIVWKVTIIGPDGSVGVGRDRELEQAELNAVANLAALLIKTTNAPWAE